MGNYLQAALNLEAVSQRREKRRGEDEALARETVAADRDAERARNSDQTRRQVSARRARFAGNGVDPGDGSADAFLDGLLAEAATRQAEGDRRSDARLASIDLQHRRRRQDLLDQAAHEQRRLLRTWLGGRGR